MRIRRSIPLATIFFTVTVTSAWAQNRGAESDATLRPAQSPASQNGDALTSEVAQLRKSLQTLNERLQAISEELLAPDAKENDNAKVKEISTNLDILTRAEERAEVLRKLLIELIEKETSYRIRMTQLDEDIRPENIERSLSGVGTTRTVEMRETRRRSLDSERKGLESLLAITSQSRVRLEGDVRQADDLVNTFRQRLFPLIQKQLDKLNPD